jgi:hypothetical protein
MLSPTSVTKEHPQPARNPRSSRIPDFWRYQSVLFERFDSRERYGETKVSHEGSVFDVVDVNYTAETKDTQKNERTPSKVYDSIDTNATPSVDCGVGRYIRILCACDRSCTTMHCQLLPTPTYNGTSSRHFRAIRDTRTSLVSSQRTSRSLQSRNWRGCRHRLRSQRHI